ncbi:MAG: chaperone modulator CbpM [Desulfobacterales bacterium]
MDKDCWTVHEIMNIFQVEEKFIAELEEYEIVCPTRAGNAKSRVFSMQEMEKFRIAKLLIEEMEVNMPGVEIILRMRQNIIAMRKQFDDILDEVRRQFEKDIQTDHSR